MKIHFDADWKQLMVIISDVEDIYIGVYLVVKFPICSFYGFSLVRNNVKF